MGKSILGGGGWLPDLGPHDGIARPRGGPVGGIVIPSQTYTGHTDFETDGDGKRTGTGGGDPVPIRIPTQAEQILARPDLVDPNLAAHNAQQFAVSKPSPIQSIASQMAAALRAGTQTGAE